MTIEMMKDYLLHKYPTKQWMEKVKNMPDDQVIAIYMRLQRAVPPKVIHVEPGPVKYAYECFDCFKSFEADNPELWECRFCGGHHLLKDPRPIKIRKV